MDWGMLDIDSDRWTAFEETWEFQGEDFTGAVFSAQVRQTNDATGLPLIDLATVLSASAQGLRIICAGSATVSAHIAAGRLSEVPEGLTGASLLALSQVGVRINEATMEALPIAGERGADLILAWDLHVTPSGGLKRKYLGGRFTVLAGATQ